MKKQKTTEHTIWDSMLAYSDEFVAALKEDMAEEYPDFTESDWQDYAVETNNIYLDDERTNLNIELEGEIVIIARLGLWDGRPLAIKRLHSNNIKDILCSQINGCSEIRFYADRYNVQADEDHHDGTNHYMYRMVRAGRDIENLESRILNGETISQSTINYYTQSIVKPVNGVFGW